jgi:hypothetical protein
VPPPEVVRGEVQWLVVGSSKVGAHWPGDVQDAVDARETQAVGSGKGDSGGAFAVCGDQIRDVAFVEAVAQTLRAPALGSGVGKGPVSATSARSRRPEACVERVSGQYLHRTRARVSDLGIHVSPVCESRLVAMEELRSASSSRGVSGRVRAHADEGCDTRSHAVSSPSIGGSTRCRRRDSGQCPGPGPALACVASNERVRSPGKSSRVPAPTGRYR